MQKKTSHVNCDEPPPQAKLLTAQSHCENTVVYPVVIVDVEGVKCPALLDMGAGNSYASAALLDRMSKRESKRETKKIEMMLGTTTWEMEQQTITVKGISEQFSMPIEVTKVEKRELVLLDNQNYQDLIHSYPHLKGVTMSNTDTKAKLPVHLILGAGEYAKIKTNIPAKIGTPGQPIAELT